MIKELQDIIFKDETHKYVVCHNDIRHIIEDNLGTVEGDVVDRIMLVVIKNYKV